VIEGKDDIHLIMEYCPGGSLADLLDKRRKIPEDEARRLFLELVNAVEYVHSFHYYHRDIKLANILLDKQGHVKLADFGLGVFKSEGRKLSKFCGSPAYLAPEIIRGDDYDGAAIDIWCLGIVLYAMVCGECPFKGSNFNALKNKIIQGKITYPGHLSVAVEGIIGDILRLDLTLTLTLTLTLIEGIIGDILRLEPAERLTIDSIICDGWSTEA